MKAIVEFDTIPQMFTRVVAHYQGQQRTALRYKDKKTNTWITSATSVPGRMSSIHRFAGRPLLSCDGRPGGTGGSSIEEDCRAGRRRAGRPNTL